MRVLARLSIRARMTIGTIVLVAAFFTVSAIAVHQIVAQLLQNSTDAVLDSNLAPYETSILTEPLDAVDTPGEGELIAVAQPEGTTVVSTFPQALTDAVGPLTSAPVGTQRLTAGGADYAVTVEQVPAAMGNWTIAAAQDLASTASILTTLDAGLSIGGVVLVGLFGIASWVLTGAALRPVERMRRSAEQIVQTRSQSLLPVGEAHDEITDLATTLNHLIIDLRAAAARERQMVSDASHELRSPVAVLQAQLELMQSSEGPADRDADIRAAQRAAARLSALVGDLLELSRLDSDTVPTGAATVAELIEEAGAAVDRARLRTSGSRVTIDLSVDADGADPAGSASIRPTTFGRLVDNLVSNSITALDGDGRVRVIARVGSDAVVLSVEDDGPGMTSEFLPRAFDRFSQQDDARSQHQGSGLGLAIVHAAAQRAGGEAHLSNRPEGGLAVTVRVPLRL